MVDKKLEIAAYYYPGWHKTGENNEWNIMRDAKPYFKGHYQPRIPLLGYLDDSKVETLQKQINLATAHGIDAFIFDWYWKEGKTYLNESIDAFMKVPTDMKFSLMWSWKLARDKYPITKADNAVFDSRTVKTGVEDFIKLLDYGEKNYFHKENYWKIDNKPYFVMYFVEGLIKLVGEETLTRMLHEGNSFLKNKGFNGLYSVGVVTDSSNDFKEVIKYKDIGYSAATGYNFLADFREESPIIQDHTTLAECRKKEWEVIFNQVKLPYIPSISSGWDATPRGIHVDDLNQKSFPWNPIVVNTTPQTFRKNLEDAKNFLKQTNQHIMHICAWNEWSEGAYLEPDDKYGYQFLKQIRDIKK